MVDVALTVSSREPYAGSGSEAGGSCCHVVAVVERRVEAVEMSFKYSVLVKDIICTLSQICPCDVCLMLVH